MANGRSKGAKAGAAFKDPRGQHVRLYHEIMDSPAWNCLTAGDQRVYYTLNRQLTKNNNGDVSLPLSKAKQYEIKSPTSLAKSLRALVAVGLIHVTRKGGSDRDGHRKPTLYCFTDIQVYDMPQKFIAARQPTNEWKQVRDLQQGEACIKSAEKKAAEQSAAKKTLHQNLIATTPSFDSKRPLTSPKSGERPAAPLQKMEPGKPTEKAGRAITARVSKLSPVLVKEKATLQKVESLCIDAIHGVPELVSCAAAASRARTQRRPLTAKTAAVA